MIYSFQPAFLALFEASGSSLLRLRTGFLVLLGLQLGFYTDYQYPPNYLDRILPFPLVKNALQIYLVPDNACQRMKHNMPLTFDYIVVGAGAAGSVIANRLSENAGRTVLLVEAGTDPSTAAVVPQFFPFVINNTDIWDYNAEIVSSSANAFKNGCPCNHGKQLGGSTAMNAMLYVCGNDRDYDSWAAEGNPGWNYGSILPYIKKSEHNDDPSVVGNGTYHGTTGYLTVTSPPSVDPYIPVLRDGFNQLGYKTLKDYNSRTYNGFVTLQQTIYLGEREDSYRAFLAPIKGRPNLYFMKNSEVTNILLKNLTATGVNIKTTLTDCPNIVVSATREVIISAGAFGSPKILMQSGIGKAADLKQVGIKQVKELSVGDNYQDHPIAVNFIKVNPGAESETLLDVLWYSQEYYSVPNGRDQRTGPFTELGIVNANAFINTLDPNATYPDVQYIFYRFPKSQEYMSEILANFAFKDEYISYLNTINAKWELLMVQTNLLHPKAKGTVKLRSNNPSDTPKITSNLLTDSDDVAVLLRGINKLTDLIESDALRSTSAEFVKFDIPECNGLNLTDAYWKCYFKYFTANMWHPTGTCKMGPSTDTEAVVDPTLKVYGINNLRVADASIMPSIVAGNTQCPTYMIGEKAADMIMAANN